MQIAISSIHIIYPDFPEGDFRTPDEDSENATTAHADHLLTLLRDLESDNTEQLAAKADLRARFTEFEMPANFVITLYTLRTSLADANAGIFNDNHEGLESTAEIEILLKQANDTVTALQGPIQNKYESQPDKIHAWKRTSRIESDPSAPDDPEPPTP